MGLKCNPGDRAFLVFCLRGARQHNAKGGGIGGIGGICGIGGINNQHNQTNENKQIETLTLI